MTNLAAASQPPISIDDSWLDYLLIALYFAFTIGIGLALRSRMKSSEDYFLSGRSLPSWVTGLAFLGANLGALEVLGMGAGAAQYGIMQAHFYWIGAIPAMVFVALFMIPFYYGSRTHSVPGFLKLRYNEATRGFNAITFAVLMVLMSGINMYAMAIVLQLVLGWSLHISILVSAVIVLAYVTLGGLSSSIYNEVLQFFLITLGLVPLVVIGLIDVGGWDGLKEAVAKPEFFHLWADTGGTDNPMAIQWFGIALGLGFFLSFGYWCTDFLVVQRALAAEDEAAAQRTPLIAAFPKILYGVLAIFPGLIVLSVMPELGQGGGGIGNSYNMAIPYAMAQYFPSGMLGVGLVALLASFMSGMAGNVTAMNTVWTYDIYRAYIKPDADDAHYVRMGRIATIGGMVLSVGAAYIVLGFASIMDYVQLLHGVFFAPLFATFLLGMFWKRTTPWGGFAGLVSGTAVALAIFAAELAGVLVWGSPMAGNLWRACIAWGVAMVVGVAVSMLTAPKPEADLRGLVYSLTERARAHEPAWYKKPWLLATGALVLTLGVNIVFF
ncbi:SSS family solute:Na+ symporter [Murinocardiopsis flavida]|uniref:SSS family solute:Na+ symporter n=1 Tax=Murinocardiopsis flavida TaxID=645275 RepID=A0A2P8DHV8_9ACTN|nr:sodium:solute symporter family protein [Murinocardiopsis flavida]PSK96793.1 SSS family solute:Na+ symporter [Murinocardiopsis flavida]